MKNLWEKITAKIDTPVWLEWLLGLVFALRIPSFFEPFYYGDEMIYLALGQGIRKGLVLYSQIHDNKPPLLYLLAAVAGNVFWFKVILAFWSLVTIYFFWKLVNHFFSDNKKIQKVATFTFALLTTLPLLEGNIVNAENFFIGTTLIAFWLIFTKKNSFTNLFLAGLIFSISTLFKIPASFDMPVILAYWLITGGLTKTNIISSLKKFGIILVGWALPLIIAFVWYYFRGALAQYVVAAFMQNIGYLSSFRPAVKTQPFLVRNFPLIIRGLIVGLGLVILLVKKQLFSKQFIFVVIWLLFTLFAVTLSERPYPHYLLQSVGPISILFGFLAAKNMHQIYVLVPLLLAFTVPVYFRFYYYDTFSYYARFIGFATKQISKDTYFNRFSPTVTRNYAIANFINQSSKTDDAIFVWGDSAPIYALTRKHPPIRFVANYHIYDFSTPQEVLTALSQNPPKFIIITPEMRHFADLEVFVNQKYILVEKIQDAEIWSRM